MCRKGLLPNYNTVLSFFCQSLEHHTRPAFWKVFDAPQMEEIESQASTSTAPEDLIANKEYGVFEKLPSRNPPFVYPS